MIDGQLLLVTRRLERFTAVVVRLLVPGASPATVKTEVRGGLAGRVQRAQGPVGELIERPDRGRETRAGGPAVRGAHPLRRSRSQVVRTHWWWWLWLMSVLVMSRIHLRTRPIGRVVG